jgi:hypothetical protein
MEFLGMVIPGLDEYNRNVASMLIFAVYLLCDPRNGLAFYCGASQFPTDRFNKHGTDPKSAAHRRMREIRAAGYEPTMFLLHHDTRDAALAYEDAMILAIGPELSPGDGGLVNCHQRWKRHTTPYQKIPVFAGQATSVFGLN